MNAKQNIFSTFYTWASLVTYPDSLALRSWHSSQHTHMCW